MNCEQPQPVLDTLATGNSYVAVTGNKQVWEFDPTGNSFVADTNSGIEGFLA